MQMAQRRVAALVVALAMTAGACGSGDGGEADTAGPSTAADSDASSTTSAPTTTAAPGNPDAPARPSSGCGTDGEVLTGQSTDEVLKVGDLERTWLQHVPTSYDGTTPMPVVLQLHGLTQPHTTLPPVTGYEKLGEQEGFIVLTPAGRTTPVPYWQATTSTSNPDVDMIGAMLDAVGAELCIDEARVYSSGISMGGLMSSALACTLSDRIAAIAPVSGIQVPPGCEPARPVPIMVFYGTADIVLPFDGGLGDVLGEIPGVGNGDGEASATTAPVGTLPAGPPPPTITDIVGQWAALQGCEDEATIEQVTDDVQLESWTACDEGSEIRFYVVDGGGHTWPGSASLLSAGEEVQAVMGYTTDQIVASELAWEFFTRHALEG